jgi:hypothetical protein
MLQNDDKYRPAAGRLKTRWAEQVNPENPLPEYPRPQMVRTEWQNLNGLWDYAITPLTEAQPEEWQGKILVPFAVESALSGVGKTLQPDECLWYRCVFSAPAGNAWQNGAVLLHFDAVDWQCEVWLNGINLGVHTGGYLPFSFEIQKAWQVDRPNELIVRVVDPTDAGMQERGKQVLNPSGIWYTAVSGIWQTVWLEPVSETRINNLRITPDLDQGLVEIQFDICGSTSPATLISVAVRAEGKLIATGKAAPGIPLILKLENIHAWSPEDPFLYGLQVRLENGERSGDQVDSYFAMRKFNVARDADGQPRFLLNNQPVFLLGPLDQGYFPDGLYTAPTDEALRFDLDYCKRLGFNMVRKHIKVEPLRWYAYCDQIGLIVWQDMPNGGLPVNTTISTLAMHFGLWRDDTKRLARAGRVDAQNRQRYRTDLQGMIDHLYSCPCVAVWGPFNEAWGQFHAREIGDWVKGYDPTRPVDATSGWFDQGGGDFDSRHAYVLKLRAPRKKGARAFVLSEFGGYSWLVPGHSWDENQKFGYKFYDSKEALTAAYENLLTKELQPLIKKGLAAAIYTELTDAEIEVNGYITYDREIEKMDPERILALHRALINGLRS